jgi:hypothetical protein
MKTVKTFTGLGLALLLGALTNVAAQGTVATPSAGLVLHDEGGAITVQFDGRPGRVGIPSWKVVLRRKDAGNIASLHVPANDPRPLVAGADVWPLGVIATKNDAGIRGTLSRGRENYRGFEVEIFRVVEASAEEIIVEVGGPSKNRHFVHRRLYTFTPIGLKMEGTIDALIDLSSVTVAFHWDRMQVADSHTVALPLRQLDRPSWVYMMATGNDRAQLTPTFAAYPFEAELRLRRTTPMYIKTFFDRNFESATEKPRLVNNNKDVQYGTRPKLFKKMICMPGGAVEKGTQQTYAIRLEFESRE